MTEVSMDAMRVAVDILAPGVTLERAAEMLERFRSTGKVTRDAGEKEIEDQVIDLMVQRFLGWKLPDDFNPDDGIRFTAVENEGTRFEFRHAPVGTNLFSATQAEAMIRYLFEGLNMPDAAPVAVEELRLGGPDGRVNPDGSFTPGVPVSTPPMPPAVGRELERLARIGIYGSSVAEVVSYLLTRVLDDMRRGDFWGRVK